LGGQQGPEVGGQSAGLEVLLAPGDTNHAPAGDAQAPIAFAVVLERPA
jgi:hypothetical protein